MTDISWTIQTASNGSVTLPGAIGESMPTFGAGREVTIQLYVESTDDSAFEILREYSRYANDSTSNTGTDIRGKPWYHESTHPTAGFDSQMVRLDPGVDVGNLRNWWVVITNASISTNVVGTSRRITLDCFILAEGAEYSGRQFVEDDFEAGL